MLNFHNLQLEDDDAVMINYNQDQILSRYEEGEIFKDITGFTGSAGVCMLSKAKNFLASDSRYEIQIEQQALSGWHTCIDSGLVPRKLLTKVIQEGCRNIIIISDFCSVGKFEDIRNFGIQNNILVTARSFAELINHAGLNSFTKTNLLKQICSAHQSLPLNKVSLSTQQKLEQIQQNWLHLFGTNNSAFIADKNFVSWFLNQRNKAKKSNMNVMYNLVLNQSGKYIVVDNAEELRRHIKQKATVSIDIHSTSLADKEILLNCNAVLATFDGTELSKLYSIKQQVELNEMQNAHLHDGVAIVNFLCWLDECQSKQEYPSELTAAEQLLVFRQKCNLFQCNSFPTISAMGKNGAIVHYSEPSNTILLQPHGLYLFDSGGQYHYGTTDITRTIAIGQPTERQICHFTAVLKAHIALATAVFSVHTKAASLDFICRTELYKLCLDYGHGTGHGVGYFGNVHEGSISISPHCPYVLHPGMILSNEPGYYKKEEYGIRIENLIEVVRYNSNTSDIQQLQDKSDTLTRNHCRNITNNELLSFKTISLAPIDEKLINKAMLDNLEMKWLNFYQQRIIQKLSGHLNAKAQSWLENNN